MLEHAEGGYRLPLSNIAPLLARIVCGEAPVEEKGAYPMPDDLELEDRMARIGQVAPENVEKLGHPTLALSGRGLCRRSRTKRSCGSGAG